MTATISKIIWLAFGIAWFLLRQRPGRRARKTPVRYSARDAREFVLLGASLTGLGIVPCLYLATHFPRFADYPVTPALSYLGIAVDVVVPLAVLSHPSRSRPQLVGQPRPSRAPHTRHNRHLRNWFGIRCMRAFGSWRVAQALLLPNWIAGPAGLVGFGILFFGRVRREEEMMIAAFGDEYRAYMRRTARVVPWLY